MENYMTNRQVALEAASRLLAHNAFNAPQVIRFADQLLDWLEE